MPTRVAERQLPSSVSKWNIASGTVAANDPPLVITQTWNNSGVTFGCIDVDVTNTNSASGSLLFNLKVGGVSKASVDKNGTLACVALNASSFISVGGSAVVITDAIQTLTNKTIDGADNTLTSLIGYINGLKVEYVSTTQIRVTTGAAWIESSSKLLRLTANSTLTPTLKSTLNGGVGSSGTLTLFDTSIYPSSGTVWVDSERIDYVGKSSTVLGTTSITRGAGGTSAVSHSSGADVNISQWYHLYLYDNSGTPTIEVSTTAPNSTPFWGTAKSKTSDTTRRYLGSFRTNTSSAIYNALFTGAGNLVNVTWKLVISTEMRALAAGTSTSNTAISLANFVPPGTRQVKIRLFSNANAGLRTDDDTMTGTDPDGPGGPGSNTGIGYLAASPSGGDLYPDTPCNASQEIRYAFITAPSSGGLYIDVYGYWLER